MILLDHQNNDIDRLSVDKNIAKSFNVLSTSQRRIKLFLCPKQYF